MARISENSGSEGGGGMKKRGNKKGAVLVRYVPIRHSEEAAARLVKALRDGILGLRERKERKESEEVR